MCSRTRKKYFKTVFSRIREKTNSQIDNIWSWLFSVLHFSDVGNRTYKSVDTLAARVQDVDGIDPDPALASKGLLGQSVPQTRVRAVYVHGDGVRIGPDHPLYVVLLEGLREVRHRECSVLHGNELG